MTTTDKTGLEIEEHGTTLIVRINGDVDREIADVIRRPICRDHLQLLSIAAANATMRALRPRIRS